MTLTAVLEEWSKTLWRWKQGLSRFYENRCDCELDPTYKGLRFHPLSRLSPYSYSAALAVAGKGGGWRAYCGCTSPAGGDLLRPPPKLGARRPYPPPPDAAGAKSTVFRSQCCASPLGERLYCSGACRVAPSRADLGRLAPNSAERVLKRWRRVRRPLRLCYPNLGEFMEGLEFFIALSRIPFSHQVKLYTVQTYATSNLFLKNLFLCFSLF